MKLGWQEFTELFGGKKARGAFEVTREFEGLCDLNRTFLGRNLPRLQCDRPGSIDSERFLHPAEQAHKSITGTHIPGTIFVAAVMNRFDRIYVPRNSADTLQFAKKQLYAKAFPLMFTLFHIIILLSSS